MKKASVVVALLLACQLSLQSQEILFRTSSSFLVDREELRQITPSSGYPSLDLKLGWQLPRDSEFSGYFGDPVGGVGVSYTMPGRMDFPYGDKMGNGIAVYGFFTSHLVRNGHFSMGYTVELGGAFLANPYDAADNSRNTFYGGSPEYYLGGGFFAMFDISRYFSVGAEAGMRHHSSGAWYVPNRGLSSFMFGLDVKYTMSEKARDISSRPLGRGIPDKPFRWGIFTGAGGHQSEGDFKRNKELYPNPEDRPKKIKRWLKGSVGAEAFWRYSRVFAIGVGSEFFYFSNAKALKDDDLIVHDRQDRSYSRFAAGVLLLQEIYYRRFAVHGGIGMYISRKMGLCEKEGPLYQKLGMRYYTHVLDGAFLGFNVRLHSFTRSDYMEVTMGKHF